MNHFYAFVSSRCFSRRRIMATATILLTTLLIIVITACGTSTKTGPALQKRAIPSIAIKAMDCSYDQPATLPSGYVEVSLVNNGSELHQDNIARLNDGISFDQFMATLKNPKTMVNAFALAKFYGGPNVIPARKTEQVILNSTL